MKKLAEAFLILLHSKFLINNFVCEKHTKYSKKIKILLNKKNQNVFGEISFCKFLEYYSIMVHSKFYLILPKNDYKKMVPKHDV